MKRVLLLLAMLLFATSASAQSREAVLDSLQYTGFRYFWDEANPANGLVKDRSTPNSVCSIASTGFGLSAICVASDHGWVTRAQARQRVLTTLNTFWNGPQGAGTTGVIGYKGLYYHWLDMNTGLRRADWNSELSTIDTALLFAGILHAREYFSQNEASENQIRALADSITWRADWTFVRHPSGGIYMGWNPSSGFSGFGRWIGYNEAMIMYLLAIGSPRHPIPGTDWNVWTSGYSWQTQYAAVGPYVNFAPLFGHQYSHCWVDFRQVNDAYMRTKGITYFENSRRATLSQITYARFNGILAQYFPTNPAYQLGESDSLWGFTASDDPNGYAAHGAPAGYDNGTITPTAPISSIPFAPDSVWPCIRNLYRTYKVYPMWTKYGFTDAFNPVKNPWLGLDVLGIDQGPIVMMIENYRNNMIWARFMKNADIQRGLSLAGFLPVTTDAADGPPRPRADAFFGAGPNPFRGQTSVRFRLSAPAHVRLAMYDVQGREVALLADDERAAGEHAITMDASHLTPGIYLYRFEIPGARWTSRAVILK
ncbi:MAG: glucoamylase family protein [Candidatus Eisenbacteria bacterium]